MENLTRSRGLKIAHLNVRSLMPKLDSLKILLEDNHKHKHTLFNVEIR